MPSSGHASNRQWTTVIPTTWVGCDCTRITLIYKNQNLKIVIVI